MISQVAQAALGNSWYGHAGFVLVQVATALILYTGANTPFTGFPFLSSFIAEDSFLPRQMTRRGHRLAFSNGIIVLAVAALTLLLVVGAHVDKLVPFYAIGVFTGFSMAGFGMAKYHHTRREKGWRHRLAVNLAGGTVSLLIVLIFAVVKFTEGAWLVVLLFPISWLVLMRLNTRYRKEARALKLVTSSGRGGGGWLPAALPAPRRARPGRPAGFGRVAGAALCRQPSAHRVPGGALRPRLARLAMSFSTNGSRTASVTGSRWN